MFGNDTRKLGNRWIGATGTTAQEGGETYKKYMRAMTRKKAIGAVELLLGSLFPDVFDRSRQETQHKKRWNGDGGASSDDSGQEKKRPGSSAYLSPVRFISFRCWEGECAELTWKMQIHLCMRHCARSSAT